jgi:predicted nucleic acid-binding protein
MPAELLFADTNLFLRYLTNDIPEQAQAFEELLIQAAKNELNLVTNSLVIAEIVWTLESYYKLTKPEIQDKVLAILNTPGLDVMDGGIVLQAALWYADKNIAWIDAYNGAWMLEHDLTTVCTFDRKHFSRLKELIILIPGEQK